MFENHCKVNDLMKIIFFYIYKNILFDITEMIYYLSLMKIEIFNFSFCLRKQICQIEKAQKTDMSFNHFLR